MKTSYARPMTFSGALWQWILWVLLSAAGMTAGVILLKVLMDLIKIAPDSFSLVAFFARVFIIGFLIAFPYSLAQWLFLRSVRALRFWLLATALTFPLIEISVIGVGLHVGNVLDTSMGKDLGKVIQDLALATLAPSIFYIPIGIAQWLVLRKYFRNSAVWIPTSYVAWVLAIFIQYLVMLLIVRTNRDSWLTTIPWDSLLTGGLQAAITGPILLLLKPRPSPGSAGS